MAVKRENISAENDWGNSPTIHFWNFLKLYFCRIPYAVASSKAAVPMTFAHYS